MGIVPADGIGLGLSGGRESRKAKGSQGLQWLRRVRYLVPIHSIEPYISRTGDAVTQVVKMLEPARGREREQLS